MSANVVPCQYQDQAKCRQNDPISSYMFCSFFGKIGHLFIMFWSRELHCGITHINTHTHIHNGELLKH